MSIRFKTNETVGSDKFNGTSVRKGTWAEITSNAIDGVWFATDLEVHIMKIGSSLYILNENNIGSIEIFAGPENKIPEGWMICDGRSLSTSKHDILYGILGTTYGSGDGTFNLPNMTSENKFAIQKDSENYIGQNLVTLSVNQIYSHRHSVSIGNSRTGGSKIAGASVGSGSGASFSSMDYHTSSVGGDEAHENRPPFMNMYYIIKV